MANKKIIFTAISPFTGAKHARKSHRAYTHAVISYETAESMRAGAVKSALRAEADEKRYLEIARYLEAGTTPEPGSPALEPATVLSIEMIRAGVKTFWEAAVWDSKHMGWTADTWRDFAAKAAMSAKYSREMVNDRFTIRERATFHHSAALAGKAMAALPAGMVSQIVEITSSQGGNDGREF